MKNWKKNLLTLALAIGVSSALTQLYVFAQDVTVETAAVAEAALVVSTADEDGLVRADSLRIESAVIEAIDKSNLRPLQKFRLKGILTSNLRPKLKQEILDTVTSQLIAADAITVTEDGAYFVQGWEQIIEMIMKFIPILLELLKLFG